MDADKRERAARILDEFLMRSFGEEGLDLLTAENSEIAGELRALYERRHAVAARALGYGVDAGGASDEESSTSRLVRRLAAKPAVEARYRPLEEIGRGGMGAVVKAWDEELGREVAMKVALQRGVEPESADGQRTLGRFLEEAQVAGQLVHPGIVPVHELGLDADGGLVFTMQLVRGRELREVFALARAGEDGWTRTRVLGVLLKVCEAMSYAHAKGVVHRDLKPSNVMVGRFGEVYVMDWGLARIVGAADPHDIRLKLDGEPGRERDVVSVRREEREADSDSPLVTMDGAVVGTPAYMAPEQARGEVEAVDRCSDVYSIGAMLYELLTGRMPYAPPEGRAGARKILAALLEGPPLPIGSVARDVPGELVAICEKAMAREKEARYADTLELAEDLRAFLENRVVAAYETGAWAEARKWVQRNRPLAIALAAVLVAVVGGASGIAYVEAQGREAAEYERGRALESSRLAEAERANVLRLSLFQNLDDLRRRADELWPARPEHVPAYDEWLAKAEAVVATLPEHEEQLAVLAARRIESDEDRWWSTQLERLVRDIGAFADDETGLVRGRSERHGWGVERRRRVAELVADDSVRGDEPQMRWAETIESIADEAECPMYGGLRIAPQHGLLPIGRDPRSGLWEFAHVRSGAVAQRDPSNGELVVAGATGIVLVLIPGDTFLMGGQADDPTAPNYDPRARPLEGPVREVTVDPFFLSKYELTQGQWLRFAGWIRAAVNPVTHSTATESSPVENTTYAAFETVLFRLGLEIPDDEQWEYACRAGTTGSTFWPDGTPMQQYANLADRSFREEYADMRFMEDYDDRFPFHAPVGSFHPNPFGLHDMLGNVWEFTKGFARGGGFESGASSATSIFKDVAEPEASDIAVGVRAMRRIE